MMSRFWGGTLCLAALLVIAIPVQADEVGDLRREVQELRAEIAAMKAGQALEASSIEKAVDEYLDRRAAGEGGGEMAGWMDGHFGMTSAEGGFDLTIGGRLQLDARFYEPEGMQNNTFDVRRARFFLEGGVDDGWGFRLQTEVSTGSAHLKDAFVHAKLAKIFGGTGSEYIDGIQLSFGQFKMPFSYAELTSSNDWDTVERPILINALAPGRDIGLQLSNSIYDGMLAYMLAISNGTNSVNESDEFSYWVRVVVAPFLSGDDAMLKNLHFGASFGTTHVMTGETAGLETAGGGPYGIPGESMDYTFDSFYPSFPLRGRQILWGLELVWWWEQLAVKAEFLWAMQEVDNGGSGGSGPYMPPESALTLDDLGAGGTAYKDQVDTMGGYLQVAYMITGEAWKEKQDKGVELVGQIEYGKVDPGKDVPEGDFWAYTVGANYYFSKNVRAMLDCVATDFGDDTLRPIYKDGQVRGGGVDFNVLLRLQLTF